MKEIKEWTRDDLLLLLNLLSHGIYNKLLPNLLEKSGLPKKDKVSIWRDEKLCKAYAHYSYLIAKRLATEPMLPTPLMQMIDTALDGADALILLHNVEIKTEEYMREFLRRFNFSMDMFPIEDMKAGHDVPLHTFLNTQKILKSVTKKVLKYVEDGQKLEFTEIETIYLEQAWIGSDPTRFDRDGPGTFYSPGSFNRETGKIEGWGYVPDMEEFEELWKDLRIGPIGYRSPRQGNPGLITFGRAFWKLQEILQGKSETKYRLCVIPDCGTLFVSSSKGKGRPRNKFCSTEPCWKRYKLEYNNLYVKYIDRPRKKGQPVKDTEWVREEALKHLSNAGEGC